MFYNITQAKKLTKIMEYMQSLAPRAKLIIIILSIFIVSLTVGLLVFGINIDGDKIHVDSVHITSDMILVPPHEGGLGTH